jgi:ADP-dependent NAD(P)H-hydrate dehydratase / NAD(P)H-hydrate epimerase
MRLFISFLPDKDREEIIVDVVTASRMREIDRLAIEEYGIPGVVLMENAGLRLVEAIEKNGNKEVVIVAGPGNNGGDGFVAARQLYQKYRVSVWITASPRDYRGEASINLNILNKLGISCRNLSEAGALKALEAELSRRPLVVDALLGTGASRELDTFYREIIHIVNQSGTQVLAVDIPSGVCADSGAILGAAVKAHTTVTFALPKQGHFLFPGASCTGTLEVADIGIPPKLLDGGNVTLTTAKAAHRLLPPRPADAHKGTFGTVLLVAGALGMSGAAVLAARAALRGGCGLLFAASPRSVQPTVAAQVAEAVTVPLPENRLGRIQEDALFILREKWRSCHALAVGPGISQDKELLPVLNGILSECPLPVVLDADALNLVAWYPQMMMNRNKATILTPHPGEAARLLSVSVEEIQADRLGSAQALARRFTCVAVLKGANTIIAAPDGQVAFNAGGNSGMATAGSGDVLTGLIASLLAQGLKPYDAARLAVYIHGLAGDLAVKNTGEAAMLAGDLNDHISHAYLELQKIHM